ncbi:tyrosine-type recombinase/integrase [Microbacterium horticulturae]|uniref:Tyrosine-type recombinase/integrase n=1 Tax=Microbacterium horticulturae TaxID=3028316 RepID=A0ABY8C530_9MICO|nr:tyrosine-type recombinase/integrase [Microbacterium sp. KACC 23027]WEG10432.1 tyrosine-type recombinase/integrase [Microbacterium sp. KACC 23027]
MASIQKRPDGMYRARFRGPDGREYSKHFKYKNGSKDEPHLGSAQQWLDEQTTAMRAGTWVDPHTSKMTLGEWLDTWLAGYASKRSGTVKSANVHAALIREKFGSRQLRSLRPSDVKAWMSELSETYATSYVYALHGRLHQVLSDAVHDGVIARNPVGRRTAPRSPRQRPYVATTEQIWALYDALKPGYKNMVLLGAFVGLRIAEMAAADRDDLEDDMFTPSKQYPSEELKTETSKNAIPVPRELSKMIRANAGESRLIPGVFGRGVTPYQLNREWIDARVTVKGLPDGFRVQDLRHYFASLLIASGLDVKVVQHRMRHASATTTLNVYGHMFPDKDESSRAAIAAVLEARKSPQGADPEGSSEILAD